MRWSASRTPSSSSTTRTTGRSCAGRATAAGLASDVGCGLEAGDFDAPRTPDYLLNHHDSGWVGPRILLDENQLQTREFPRSTYGTRLLQSGDSPQHSHRREPGRRGVRGPIWAQITHY